MPARLRWALAIGTVGGVALLVLVALGPGLPQGSTNDRVAAAPQETVYAFTSPVFAVEGARGVDPTRAQAGDALVTTFVPSPIGTRPSGRPSRQVAVEFLLFGPFASQGDRARFSSDLSRLQSQPAPTPDAQGRLPEERWPESPRLAVSEQVFDNQPVLTNLRLTLPARLPAGLYLLYRGTAWRQSGNAASSPLEILPAGTPTQSR